MKRKSIAVVGAAETTELGLIPDLSQIQLHADAALNAMADAGLKPSDIDGLATTPEWTPNLANYLGITPTWVDGTMVGGCSFMLHVRHAAAAINEGLCNTVLITHGESGRSRVGVGAFVGNRASLEGQFEVPFGIAGPTSTFTIPVLRYMKNYGVSEEQLAMVAVIQREWAAKNPRATMKDPITVDDVLGSRMIAYPFRLMMCCLVTDGGGALILTSAGRAKDFPRKPVYILGTGESVESWMISQMEDFTTSKAFRVSGKKAFRRSRHHPQGRRPSDDLRRLRASAALWTGGPGLLQAGRGRGVHLGAQYGAGRQAAGQHQWRRAELHALRHVRHVCVAGERAPDAWNRTGAGARARRSQSAHGVGGMFAASGTIIFSNEAP